MSKIRSLLTFFSMILIAPSVQAAINYQFTPKITVKVPNSTEKVVIGLLSKGKKQPEKNAEARLINNDKIISSVQFKSIGLPEDAPIYKYSGKMLSDKGFSNHPQIISFHCEYPACDYAFGDVLLVLKNSQLSYGLTCSTIANEFVYGSYKYIFPNDKKGKPNQLTIIYSTEENETKRVSYQKEIYAWDGTKFKLIAGLK